ncbi:MAG: hypothetical protein HC902_04480 [Calothrix sp. SM1_5_4]|nr:hypothetical protein [Calothrix sp. SM1_5_4]
MNALKQRERDVVTGLLNQRKSGLVVIGEKHLQSLTDSLREACLGASTLAGVSGL